MPAGLQVFDANGKITLNLADRSARFWGSFTVPAWSGRGPRTITHQINSGILQQGTPFVYFNRFSTVPVTGRYDYTYELRVTVNNSGLITVYMQFDINTNVSEFRVFYGGY